MRVARPATGVAMRTKPRPYGAPPNGNMVTTVHAPMKTIQITMTQRVGTMIDCHGIEQADKSVLSPHEETWAKG